MWLPVAEIALGMVLVCAPFQEAESKKRKGPDLGFDYSKMIQEHMILIGEGKGEQAITVLTKHMARGFTEEFNENLKKKLALVYGGGGKCLDHEIVGYKQITSRNIRFYSVTHFEKFPVTYSYLFFKGANGDWILHTYTITDGLDELDKITPLTPFRKAD